MAEDINASAKQVQSKYRFKIRSEDEMKKLLEDKDKKSTQRATQQAILKLNDFLKQQNLADVDNISIEDLASALRIYYPAIKPQQKSDYSAQTLKCHRAAINRHIKKTRGVDIAQDAIFTKANEALTATLVECKRLGKADTKPTKVISDPDLERIAEYFNHDYMNKPEPRRLQQNVIFNIIYYFCRRGRENLYSMMQTTFKVVVEPDGTEYMIQACDELDKNHGIENTTKNKQGRIYAKPGNYKEIKNTIRMKC